MHCPLCGSEFDPDTLDCQSGCPIAHLQGCHLVCCPNCGYQMVDERKSAIAQLLRRMMGTRPEPRGAGAPPAGPAPPASTPATPAGDTPRKPGT